MLVFTVAKPRVDWTGHVAYSGLTEFSVDRADDSQIDLSSVKIGMC